MELHGVFVDCNLREDRGEGGGGELEFRIPFPTVLM